MKAEEYSKKSIPGILVAVAIIIAPALLIGGCSQVIRNSIPASPTEDFIVTRLQREKGYSGDVTRVILSGPGDTIVLRVDGPCSLRVGDICYWNDATTSLRFERAFVDVDESERAENH